MPDGLWLGWLLLFFMTATRHAIQRELSLLRRRLRQNEELLRKAAIQCEYMLGAFDAAGLADEEARRALADYKRELKKPASDFDQHMLLPRIESHSAN
jgi:hypothetical protein